MSGPRFRFGGKFKRGILRIRSALRDATQEQCQDLERDTSREKSNRVCGQEENCSLEIVFMKPNGGHAILERDQRNVRRGQVPFSVRNLDKKKVAAVKNVFVKSVQ